MYHQHHEFWILILIFVILILLGFAGYLGNFNEIADGFGCGGGSSYGAAEGEIVY